MSFKDIIKADISNVFINIDEFSDVHNIDGKDVSIMFDENELIEREIGRTDKYVDGVYKKNLMFYIRADDLSCLPHVGRLMTFDNEEYIVTDSVDEMGIYSISLEVYDH